MATTIRIGKWDINPSSGAAGANAVNFKLIEVNTGRLKYEKLVRGYTIDPGANAEDIIKLSLEAANPFLTMETTSADIAYSGIEQLINGESNAEKFRVSTTGSKPITLKPNTGYTVLDNVGTFTGSFGLSNKGAFSALVGFASNSLAESVAIPVLLEFWNGTIWVSAGTFTITQGTADSGATFVLDPETISILPNTLGSIEIGIDSNVAYTIEKQGSADMSWATLSQSTGIAGTATLEVSYTKQAVGAAARNLTIVYKNAVTGSVIAQQTLSQAAGDAYAIAWSVEELAFLNNEVGQIKTATLTTNADFAIEEVIAAP